MKTLKKLALFAAILAPLFASAQFVDISDSNTTSTKTITGLTFHDLIIDMNSDVGALFTPEDDPDLSLLNTINFNNVTDQWTAGVGGANDITLVKIDNKEFFKLTGRVNIGYIGNESGDDNELYLSAYDDSLKTTADTNDSIDNDGNTITYENPDGYKLFDYDAGDPNSTDDPPMSYTVTLEGNTTEAFLQFTHWDRNSNWYDSALQTDQDRFKIWAELDQTGKQTGQFLIAISDRNTGFDSDRDDGFFFLDGDIIAVPEPSQIAMLAMLGLGGALYLRRRIKK